MSILINIPEAKSLEIRYLVLDFNGTLAIDGKLIDGTKPLLELLSNQLIVHVLTADTFGTAERELSGINCIVNVLSHDLQDMQKESYVFNLGENHVIAIGNGLNDALMVKCAALGIVVVQKEGASMETLLNADIVCTNILDAFELLLNPQRIVATLRK